MRKSYGLPEEPTFRIDVPRENYFEIHWAGIYLSYDGINLFVYEADRNTYLRAPRPFDSDHIAKIDRCRLERIRTLLAGQGGLFPIVTDVPLGPETISYLRMIAEATGIETTIANSGVDYIFHPFRDILESTDPQRTRDRDRARQIEGMSKSLGKNMVLNPLFAARRF